MNDYMNRLSQILDEVKPVLAGVSAEACNTAVEKLCATKRVFLAGAGRSGLLMQCFGMRLMHAGLMVHLVGDATTPSIGADDLLWITSGSGTTATMVALAEKALKADASLAVLTYTEDSLLAKLVRESGGVVLVLPVPLDSTRPGKVGGTQILGTLFDEAVFLLTTLLTEAVGQAKNQTESDYARRHANLE